MVVQGTKGDGSDVGTAAQYSNSMQFDTQAFQQRFLIYGLYDLGQLFCLQSYGSKIRYFKFWFRMEVEFEI